MKSRVVAVRLSPAELDVLSSMPGSTTTEKIRLMIQSQTVVDTLTDQIADVLTRRFETFEERVELVVRSVSEKAEQENQSRHAEVADWVGRLGKAIIQRMGTR